jgi:hypothetical protein
MEQNQQFNDFLQGGRQKGADNFSANDPASGILKRMCFQFPPGAFSRPRKISNASWRKSDSGKQEWWNWNAPS